MQLGRKIRDLRLRRGLTVQQLAEATGLSKGFVSQVENGRTSPSLATLSDLAKSLETSVAYLVVEEDQVPYVVRRTERPHMSVNGNTSRVEVMSAQPRRNLELLHAELPALDDALANAVEAVQFAQSQGFAAAMNRYNQQPKQNN